MASRAVRLATALLAVATLVLVAESQSSLPACTAAPNGGQVTCTGGNWSTNVQTCEHLNVTCPGYNVADLGVTIGYAKPSGTANGTIVFLSPEGGTAPSGPPTCPYPTCYTDAKYFDDYLNTYGFEAVQTAWDSAWEDTGSKNLERNPRNVGYAAARAAALLSWIDVNLYGALTKSATAGMCAQGNSAGGGAIAYILAWYGGYSYLDHAVFLSSPPLSDLEQAASSAPNKCSLSQFALQANWDAAERHPGRRGLSTSMLSAASGSGPTTPRSATPACAAALRPPRRKPTPNGRE